MKIEKILRNNCEIIIVKSKEVCISDVQTALDFAMTIKYETGATAIVLNKEAITNDFFNLSTKIAGDILQKFINYHIKLAIVGDFIEYNSQALRAFIYESNKGNHFYFVSSEEEAIDKLVRAY